jgi:predicted nucleic acid-binding protein
MIVVDSSALVHAFTAKHPSPRLVARLRTDALHAPHLIDAEFTHAVRGLTIGAKISNERAEGARALFAATRMSRYELDHLNDRVWSLRHNMTAYDAYYVALAEALDCQLVTSDGKLAAAFGHNADIQVYPAS